MLSCLSCFLVCLFIAALWSSAGKGLTSCEKCEKIFLALVCNVELCFFNFPCGILGQVWCLILSMPDLCLLSYFVLCGDVSHTLGSFHANQTRFCVLTTTESTQSMAKIRPVKCIQAPPHPTPPPPPPPKKNLHIISKSYKNTMES